MKVTAKSLKIGDIFKVGFVQFQVVELELTTNEVRLLIQPSRDKNEICQQVTLHPNQIVNVVK